MRKAGVIANSSEAERFAAYLLTLGIRSHLDAEGSEWAVWIRDEDHLVSAKNELEQFLVTPNDVKYQNVKTAASAVLQEEQRRLQQRKRNIRDMRGQWGRPPARRMPFVMALIAMSVLVFVLSDMGTPRTGINGVLEHLLFCRIRVTHAGIDAPRNGFEQIQQGEVWRLITPIFIHFGLFHLVMNLQALYVLGGAIEERKGTLYLALLVFAVAIASNVLQYSWPLIMQHLGASPLNASTPNPLFGGISGVVFGLFGYVWMKSWYDPRDGMVLPGSSIFVCMLFYTLCVLRDLPSFEASLGNVLPHVANTAHTVGLVMGVAVGYISSMRSNRKG